MGRRMFLALITCARLGGSVDTSSHGGASGRISMASGNALNMDRELELQSELADRQQLVSQQRYGGNGLYARSWLSDTGGQVELNGIYIPSRMPMQRIGST